MSIKTRITIWYTAFLLLVAALLLGFIFSMGEWKARGSLEASLVQAVEKAASQLEYDDDGLELDDDVQLLSGGVYISIYDGSGMRLFGGMPGEFPVMTPLTESGAAVRTVAGENTDSEWLVLDIHRQIEGFGDVWVRGAASLSAAEGTVSTLLRLALVALPALVLICAVVGYLITRQGFLPVRRMAETAEEIGGGNDLSRRIGPPYGKDEIGALGRAFDGMFARLEEAFNKEKQFTADASHELRTPAAVIMAQSEYGLQHPSEAAASLTVIQAQAKKLTGLLSQLLLLARADNQSSALRMETLELSELCETVAQQQKELAAEQGISVHCDVQPNLTIRGDESLIMRLLINLIENAVRYNKPGGSVWISLAADETANCVRGSVKDDGIGIPKELQGRVFERFFQAEPSRSGQGSGLGLAMVKWIAEVHGGGVSLASEPGQGSTFEFILPR